MAYAYKGTRFEEPPPLTLLTKPPVVQPARHTQEALPALAPHTRRKPQVWSFEDDEERRRAAKRETNRAYDERNRDLVNARQREKYRQKKLLRETA